jgi:hypothetical protein
MGASAAQIPNKTAQRKPRAKMWYPNKADSPLHDRLKA